MKFLCGKHRLWLTQNPEELLPGWRRTCRMGREALVEEHWHQAAVFFGNAWEMSELLLSAQPGRGSQQRYIETAGEMMWALRAGEQSDGCRFVFSQVLSRLEQEARVECSHESLSLLRELAFGDEGYAYALLQAQRQTHGVSAGYLH